MTLPELLAWARGEYARLSEPDDRDFYAGVIDAATGAFDVSRCPRGLDPVNEADYCEGGREAIRRLRSTPPTGRRSHGA